MGLIKSCFYVAFIAFFLVNILPVLWNSYTAKPLPVHVQGTVKESFKEVESIFSRFFEEGRVVGGAAYSVYHRGRLVVDLWGGYTDEASPWRHDTLGLFFSATKAIAATCANMLIYRGHMKPDDLVIKYWPEFGNNGKDNVTVRMLLNHQGGLSYPSSPVTEDVILDESGLLLDELLANQRPVSQPGGPAVYHAVTFAWVVSGLIRRVDPQRRELVRFVREEISEPLDVEFRIGLPLNESYRSVRILHGVSSRDHLYMLNTVLTDSNARNLMIFMLTGAFDNAMRNVPEIVSAFNSPYTRRLPIGSMYGFASTRDFARIMGRLAHPDKDPLLPKSYSDGILQYSTPADYNLLFALGFVNKPRPLSSQGPPLLGHPGYGGQEAYFDTTEGIGYAYTQNALYMGATANVEAPLLKELLDATYRALLK